MVKEENGGDCLTVCFIRCLAHLPRWDPDILEIWWDSENRRNKDLGLDSCKQKGGISGWNFKFWDD